MTYCRLRNTPIHNLRRLGVLEVLIRGCSPQIRSQVDLIHRHGDVDDSIRSRLRAELFVMDPMRMPCRYSSNVMLKHGRRTLLSGGMLVLSHYHHRTG